MENAELNICCSDGSAHCGSARLERQVVKAMKIAENVKGWLPESARMSLS